MLQPRTESMIKLPTMGVLPALAMAVTPGIKLVPRL